MARLRLFAAVRERAMIDTLDVELTTPMPLRDFLTLSAERGGIGLALIMNQSLLYAVNGEMRGLDFSVGPSDEVAVMPPLSGGV